jgi:hypothetical protein
MSRLPKTLSLQHLINLPGYIRNDSIIQNHYYNRQERPYKPENIKKPGHICKSFRNFAGVLAITAKPGALVTEVPEYKIP